MAQSSLIPWNPEAPQRTRRHEQLVSEALNSLILAGVIAPTPAGFGMANLFFTGVGPPASALGFTGDYYLDLSTGTLYQNE